MSQPKIMAVEKIAYKSVLQEEKNGDSLHQPPPEPPKGFGTRHTQALLLFISLSVGYSMRAHLGVTLVAMTSDATLEMWYPNYTKHCLNANDSLNERKYVYKAGIMDINDTVLENCREMNESLESWSVRKVYYWEKPTQEMIISSFFVGYTSMMMPMGIMAQKVGGKIPLMIALGANGVLSILTPWVPLFSGWIGVCVCRLLQGMTQAAFYPSIHTILGRWAPVSERSRLASYIYTGSQFGTVIAFQLSGLFAGSPSLGWPAIFWLCGVVSLACCGILACFGAATPHDHPSISAEEMAYIVGGANVDVVPKKRRTPWKHILSSPSIWGVVTAHAGSSMVYLIILMQIPLYMNKILGVDIKKNGLYSSLPYISMYFTTLVFGYLADWMMNKKMMSLVNIRRLGNSMGMLISSLFLVAFCFVNNTLAAVIFLVLCLSTHSGIHVGYHVNSIDLAPNFAGPIMALGNMLANLISLVDSVLVSEIVGNDVTNQHKWQILFIIVAGIQIIANMVFVVFAKGTVQSWNFYDEDRLEKDKSTARITDLPLEFCVIKTKTHSS